MREREPQESAETSQSQPPRVTWLASLLADFRVLALYFLGGTADTRGMETSASKPIITRAPYADTKNPGWDVLIDGRSFSIRGTRVYRNSRPGYGGNTHKHIYHYLYVMECRAPEQGGNRTVASFTAYSEPRAKGIAAILKFLAAEAQEVRS